MKKILVKGPAYSASGYGEQTRFALNSLRAYQDKFDIFLQNINWGKTGWILPDHPDRNWLDEVLGKTQLYMQNGGNFDVSLQVTIPNEFQMLAPINIGYTAGIETTKIAPEWIEKCNMMNKLIVVSNHAKYGFEHTNYEAVNKHTGEKVTLVTNTPVDVVNYAVNTDIKPVDLNLDLSTSFNFLAVAQWGIRKNLETTVISFLEEFAEESDVGLVLKVSFAKNNKMDRMFCEKKLAQLLANFPNRKCKVYLLHGNMTTDEVHALYTHPNIKAIVSTSHGEGFGLPLFEAAYSGLPVIAPNWSGQTDFLYAPVKDKKTQKVKNKPMFMKIDYDMGKIQEQAVWDGVLHRESSWCYPKKNSTRDCMREVFKNYGPILSKAKDLKKHLLSEFTKEKKYRQFVEAVGLPEEASFNVEEWLSKMNVQEVE